MDNHRKQAAIADALRTQPQQPAPPDLLDGVMRRIQASPATPVAAAKQIPQVWYKTFAAWSAAALLLVCALWAGWALLPLPVDWPARLQFLLLVLQQRLLAWQNHLSYSLPQYGLTLGLLLMLAAGAALAGMAGWASAQSLRSRPAPAGAPRL